MQWSEVTTPAKPKVLRQFAGLCLLFAAGLLAWKAWQGALDDRTIVVASVLGAFGVVGIIRPLAIRLIYTGWMIAVFPIGWTMSRVLIGLMFFVVFTPVALAFRLFGRDALQRKRSQAASYWVPMTTARSADSYLRQS